MRRAVMLGLLAAALGLAQPVVSAVQNNYSYIPPGVPQYGIAQGSIFVVFGTGLANTSTGLQSIPLRTTVEGVSAAGWPGGASSGPGHIIPRVRVSSKGVAAVSWCAP